MAYTAIVLTKRKGEIFVGDLLVNEPTPNGFLGLKLGATVAPLGWTSHPNRPTVHIPIRDINVVVEELVEHGTEQHEWFDADGMPKLTFYESISAGKQ